VALSAVSVPTLGGVVIVPAAELAMAHAQPRKTSVRLFSASVNMWNAGHEEALHMAMPAAATFKALAVLRDKSATGALVEADFAKVADALPGEKMKSLHLARFITIAVPNDSGTVGAVITLFNVRNEQEGASDVERWLQQNNRSKCACPYRPTVRADEGAGTKTTSAFMGPLCFLGTAVALMTLLLLSTPQAAKTRSASTFRARVAHINAWTRCVRLPPQLGVATSALAVVHNAEGLKAQRTEAHILPPGQTLACDYSVEGTPGHRVRDAVEGARAVLKWLRERVGGPTETRSWTRRKKAQRLTPRQYAKYHGNEAQ